MASADDTKETTDYANNPKYAPYEKLKRIGADEIRIGNKMIAAGFSQSEIVSYFGYAPPIFKTEKRYDVEQEQKLKKVKLFIEDQTKISTVRIIEGFLRDIQKVSNYNDSKMRLFQIVPIGITHLCYKYCTQFKYYLVLLYSRYHLSPEMKILGINDIERTNQDLSKQIKHIVGVNSSRASRSRYGAYSMQNALLYIPQLTVSDHYQKVLHDFTILDNLDIPLSAIFTSTDSNVNMLYFYSPYFYDYNLDVANNKKLLYYQHKIPANTYVQNLSTINDAVHIPFSNQMLTVGLKKGKNVVSVMDLNNLKWLTNARNYDGVKLNNDMVLDQSLCLSKNKLFLIGGRAMGYGVKALTDVEILDCSTLADLNKDGCKVNVKSVALASKMNISRMGGSCDVMEVKNSMIVIGGGYQTQRILNNSDDHASNSMECYDQYKDKWMLHGAKTKYYHQTPKLWCSGNLVFITGGLASVENSIGGIGKIECVDIRENSNKWQVLDERDVQKLFNLFNTNYSFRKQGIFI